MIRRIKTEYDIHHTGDEVDRLEIITLINHLAKMCEHDGAVTVESDKADIITVTIEQVEAP